MTAQGIGEISKPLGGEKQCTVCLSDNNATAASCVNCGAELVDPARNKPPQRDQKGEQTQQNTKQQVFMGIDVNRMIIPTGVPLARAAQIMPSIKMNPQHIKPIKIKRQLSDDDVSVVDENHLDNVQHSADHLGL